MRTSNTRARTFISTVGKIVMALVFASMIGGISIAPAFGKDKDNDRHEGYHDQGRTKHGHRAYYQPSHRYYYPEPVYAPPPVIYVPDPYQSPGINLVFPVIIR
jgi:hypothetical protein